MKASTRRPARWVILIVAAFTLVVTAGLGLALGPAPHHVTKDMAIKIAVTHLLQPGEQVPVQAKLAREWQLTLLSSNDGGNVWSNQLVWFVLVPGGHFAHSGPCCSPPAKTTWDVALIEDHAGSAQLDGVISGAPGDRPGWYDRLPDLSGGQ